MDETKTKVLEVITGEIEMRSYSQWNCASESRESINKWLNDHGFFM